MIPNSERDRAEKTRNTPRFFVEHPQISWVFLVAVLAWGWFGYRSMPQRKDPDIPVRVALASCPWPGATAQQVEQFVTRPIEDTIAQNKTIHPATVQIMEFAPFLSQAPHTYTCSLQRVQTSGRNSVTSISS